MSRIQPAAIRVRYWGAALVCALLLVLLRCSQSDPVGSSGSVNPQRNSKASSGPVQVYESSEIKAVPDAPGSREVRQRRGSAVPFDVSDREILGTISIQSMNADLKLTDALKKFLGINDSTGKEIEAGVQAAYAKAQDYMAGNLYVVEESKEQSVVVVDSNPQGGLAKEELKAKFVDMLGQDKGDFLWRQLSGRFQSDLADFGESRMIVRIKALPAKDESGKTSYNFETWNIEQELFSSVHELMGSPLFHDASMARFRGSFTSKEIPKFLQPVVSDKVE